MSKKYDKRTLIKLDPDLVKQIREYADGFPIKPSLAKTANWLIRDRLRQTGNNNI